MTVAVPGETILIAADHAGFELKQRRIEEMSREGFKSEDLGAHSEQPDDDYPVYAHPLAHKISRGDAQRGWPFACPAALGAPFVLRCSASPCEPVPSVSSVV